MANKTGKWDGKPLFCPDLKGWHLLRRSRCIYAMLYCPVKDHWEPQPNSRMQLRSFEMAGLGYSYFSAAIHPEYIAGVVDAERERCMKICKDVRLNEISAPADWHNDACEACIRAIRSAAQ